MLALLAGSVFVAYVVTQLAQVEGIRRTQALQTARASEVARGLASRAASLLEAKDELRLAMVAASAAQFGRYRVMVLDVGGVVRIDTGVGQGGQQHQILTSEGAFDRGFDDRRRESLAPALGLSGLVGEIRVRYPASAAAAVAFSPSLFGGTLLACLTLIGIGAFMTLHWTAGVREAVTTAHALGHGDLAARCQRRAGGVIRELQDGLQDLAGVLGAGAQQVEQSFLELAYQSVEVIERRGKVGHSERTRTYAAMLARRLGLSEGEQREIEIAARLHDLGEVYEPPLDAEATVKFAVQDRDRMRGAPSRGADVIAGVKHLEKVAGMVRHHRERFNGTGFPGGLHGERIPLGARIVGIADAYDQLTTMERGPRPALSWPDALDVLREDRGETFDPWLVDLFEEEVRKAPMPRRESTPVMLSPGGLAPYKAVESAESEESSEASASWIDDLEDELEVLGEEPGGER